MDIFTREKRTTRFSSSAYLGVDVFLALGGLAASIYLAWSHYHNFTDVGYQSFCAISRSFNCDTVSQSPYAILLRLPLAVWGSLGYLFNLLLIAFFRAHNKKHRGWVILFTLAAVFSLISIYLAIVSSLLVRSYCLMCIVTYGINFMLLLCSWLALRRFSKGNWIDGIKNDLAFFKEKSDRAISAGAIFLLVAASIVIFYPRYWHFQDLTITVNMHRGVTEEGHPWIGAKQPLLTITEFTDYMCFQCGKMHSHLRRLVHEYPDRIRLVHRHFPLDHMVNPMVKEIVHPNSGLLSLFAIFAQQSGKFWQVNDRLFLDAREKKTIKFNSIVKETGLGRFNLQEMIKDKHLISILIEDIQAGIKLGITATPSYVIDGKLYTGTIPEDVLSQILLWK